MDIDGRLNRIGRSLDALRQVMVEPAQEESIFDTIRALAEAFEAYAMGEGPRPENCSDAIDEMREEYLRQRENASEYMTSTPSVRVE